ncbi:p20 [Blackberry vein banding-associated virus]|uniref:p20 n=1 Tax=Blackberry vein banding-associated virus TaxID=1381464 RepID=S5TK45_9CLOS|nr:p20 [Blackberry vein banding-associated virus]AGS48187.1 p20 [Blackberry vein banding-associated virus]
MSAIKRSLINVAKKVQDGDMGAIVRARSLLKMTLHNTLSGDVADGEDKLTAVVELLVEQSSDDSERELLAALCGEAKGTEWNRLAREVLYGIVKYLDDVEVVILRCDEVLAQSDSNQTGGSRVLKRAAGIARERFCAVLPAGLARLSRGESLKISDVVPDARDCVTEPIATFAIYTLLVRGAYE